MSKAYELTLEDRGDYIYAVVGGEKLTAQIAAAYWNEIAEECFEKDIRKIMIEKKFLKSVTPDEMLRMADHLGQLLPNRRIAFLDRFHHDDINELGKRLARNRDVMMQIFNNREDAEKWLRAN
jgi:dsDNA-binding SOS-regulon protein